jgi:hypothetical protein
MTPELGRPRLMLALDCRRSRTANGVTGAAALFVCSPRRAPPPSLRRHEPCGMPGHERGPAPASPPPPVRPRPCCAFHPFAFPFLSIGVGVVARHPRRFALLGMHACFAIAPASLPSLSLRAGPGFSIHTATTVLPKPPPFAIRFLPQAKPKRKPRRRRRCLAHHVGG